MSIIVHLSYVCTLSVDLYSYNFDIHDITTSESSKAILSKLGITDFVAI